MMMFSQSLTEADNGSREPLSDPSSRRAVARYVVTRKSKREASTWARHRAGNGGEHGRQRSDVEVDAGDEGRLAGDAGDGSNQGGGEARQPELDAPQPVAVVR
jgi:hypothetical protein